MAPLINPLLASEDPWSWLPNFSWGGSEQPQQAPLSNPIYNRTAPEGGNMGRLPPPDIPQMPPVPSNMEHGPNAAWGGPVIPNAAASSPIAASTDMGVYGQMPEAEKKFSFMDNPGASDAMVAFGAAMLKAPDFNTGLGDAALAVNQVAKSYRMPTEQDYARAKMLGMTARLARGYDDSQQSNEPNYGGATLGYAPLGPNGEDVAVPAYMDPAQGMLYQMPDGTKSNVPPQGWVKATDSAYGATNRYDAKEQSQLQAKVAAEVRSANLSAKNYKEMLGLVDTSGVGSDLRTRLASQIAMLGGYDFAGIDVSDQAVFNQKFKELNIDFAQKLQGQGQITEFERQIIAESLPQAGMNADAAKRVLNAMIAGAERKQEMWRVWTQEPGVKQDFKGRYEVFEADYLANADAAQRRTGGGSSTSAPAAEGSTNSGIKWKVK